MDDEWPIAEGFSRSVARVLEERDIDALYHARPAGDLFEIVMRNEALETHAVRHLKLLYAQRPENGRVFATHEGIFYPARNIMQPAACLAFEGDCLESILAMDGKGRISLTDSTDLNKREIIELEFSASAGEQSGLVIGARHTFVSTHIFYQMIAYLGYDAASWLVMLESGDLPEMPPFFDALQEMGEIRVSVEGANGDWIDAGIFNEAGPIATDVQVIPLSVSPASPEEIVRIRLDLTRGFWRLDYIALAELDDPVIPVMLEPVSVSRDGEIDSIAQAMLLNSDRYLITYPGDEYRIVFNLTASPEDPELFLDSKGYYYEWMRQEWLEEHDPVRAFQLFYYPELAFRDLAKSFKKVEAEMETLFWESRIRRANP
jgi:hypothetical protein